MCQMTLWSFLVSKVGKFPLNVSVMMGLYIYVSEMLMFTCQALILQPSNHAALRFPALPLKFLSLALCLASTDSE